MNLNEFFLRPFDPEGDPLGLRAGQGLKIGRYRPKMLLSLRLDSEPEYQRNQNHQEEY